MKLAERTIQFADTITVLTEGYVRAGRAAHAEGSTMLATKHYSAAIEGHPKHVLAAIGLAQMQMQNGQNFLHSKYCTDLDQTKWLLQFTLLTPSCNLLTLLAL